MKLRSKYRKAANSVGRCPALRKPLFIHRLPRCGGARQLSTRRCRGTSPEAGFSTRDRCPCRRTLGPLASRHWLTHQGLERMVCAAVSDGPVVAAHPARDRQIGHCGGARHVARTGPAKNGAGKLALPAARDLVCAEFALHRTKKLHGLALEGRTVAEGLTVRGASL